MGLFYARENAGADDPQVGGWRGIMHCELKIPAFAGMTVDEGCSVFSTKGLE
jgi:hypothetical protein